MSEAAGLIRMDRVDETARWAGMVLTTTNGPPIEPRRAKNAVSKIAANRGEGIFL
jgi:hypothetical protein